MKNITLNRLIEHIKSTNEDGKYDELINDIDSWITATKENKAANTKPRKIKENNPTTNEISNDNEEPKNKLTIADKNNIPQGEFVNLAMIKELAESFAEDTRKEITNINIELTELESPVSKFQFVTEKMNKSHYLQGQLSGIYGLLKRVDDKFNND